MPNSNEKAYDIIIVGSGMGALTVGSLMSQIRKKKVLILEQHYVAGGFTHTFKREKGYKWDVGIHYVGDLEDGHVFRDLFDYTTRGGVHWNKMPYIYDKFVYPDFTFEAPSDQQDFEKKLIEQFPHEEQGIRRYMKDVMIADEWYRKNIIYKHIYSIAKPFVKPSASSEKLALMTTREYLDMVFTDEKLKAVLASQWGNYGAVPALSSFTNHAMVVRHFFKGGYYPVGSSKTIVQSVEPIIRENGGDILVNHRVQEIIIRNGKAVGVKVLHKQGKKFVEKEFYADKIVSDAGAYNTYCKLLPEPYAKSYKDDLETFPDGLCHVCLYIGFKENPGQLGFRGENHWIFDHYDLDGMFRDIDAVVDGRMKMAFLSFPSLKDPQAKAHTGEIITYISYEKFAKWKDELWKNRAEDYEALKEKIAQEMLDFIEEHYPGFRDLVDFYELSTPLSTEHFTAHKKGAIYGMLTIPDRFRKKWNRVDTPVRNLYLTGADAAVLGVAGAFTGGIFATIRLLGGPLFYPGLMKKAKAFGVELKKQNRLTVHEIDVYEHQKMLEEKGQLKEK